MSDIWIAPIGAGAIRCAHSNGAAETLGVVISWIVNPSAVAKTLADELAIAWLAA
jgi:hypothetical protein